MTIKDKIQSKTPQNIQSNNISNGQHLASTTIPTGSSITSTNTNNGNSLSTLQNSKTKFAIPSCSSLVATNAICHNTNLHFKNWPVNITDDGGSSSATASDSTTPKRYHHHHNHHHQFQHHNLNQIQNAFNCCSKNKNNGNGNGNSLLNVGNIHGRNGSFNVSIKQNDSTSNVLNNARLTTSVTSDCGTTNSSEHSVHHHHHHHHHHHRNTNDGNENVHNPCNSYIKSSLSMTSLPPPANESHQENKEVIKAKLRLERPYNSLKKKRNSDRNDTWRNSWGSGHSQSSCSLHSNATGIIGKDEFWAALQTNYNYIMDTNLLDTCREARCEIEGTTTPIIDATDCCGKLLQSPRIEIISEDPRELRKWLRDMENKISTAPSLLEATQLSIDELQRRLNDHSVLYCQIVSHARVVGACIKAATEKSTLIATTTTVTTTTTTTTALKAADIIVNETLNTTDNNSSADNSFNSLSSAEEKLLTTKETTPTNTENNSIEIETLSNSFSNNNNTNSSQTNNTPSSANISSNSKKLDNIKSLERRYHLLYLKAIEVQCLFEGLLKKKTYENTLNEDYLSNCESETDDEPVSKLARLSDSECNIRDHCIPFNENIYCHHQEINSDYIKSEEEFDDADEDITPRTINDIDEVDCSLDFIREWQNYSFNSSNATATSVLNETDVKISNQLQLNDSNTEFDADSEGSDTENLILTTIKKRQKRINLSADCIGKNRHPLSIKRRLSHSPFNKTKQKNEFYYLSDFDKKQFKTKNLTTINLKLTNNKNMDTSTINVGGVINTPLLQQNSVVVQNTTVYDCNRNSPNSNQDKKLFTKNSNQNLNRSPNSISIGINTNCNQKINKNINSKCHHNKNCITTDENLLDICNDNNSSSCCGVDNNINIGPQRVSTPISPAKLNNNNNNNNNKRQGKGDASKFNRSNRKSKNCAIFYFKHLDTDNETNFGLSSQGEHELNQEPSSGDDDDPIEDDFEDDEVDEIDEGWLYTNNNNNNNINNNSTNLSTITDLINGNCENDNIIQTLINEENNRNGNGGHQLSADDSDKENKEIIVPIETQSQHRNINNVSELNFNNRDANGNIQEHRSSPIRSTIPLVQYTKSEIQYHKFPPTPSRMITTTTVTAFATANTAELIIIENSDNECQQQLIEEDLNKNQSLRSIPISISNNSNNTAITIANTTSSLSTSSTEMTQITTKEEPIQSSNHDSIKQLVLDAENLVREDCMKTPTKKSIPRTPKTLRSQKTPKTPKTQKTPKLATIKKRDSGMNGSNIQRVHEWLEHQPMSPKKEQKSTFTVPTTTDCEASGENTESDTGCPHESDTSEGLTDSVATCMQTGGSTSHCTSTEIIGGSAEPMIPYQNGSNLSLNGKVIRRTIQNRRNSDRPWSVSCLSQLTTTSNGNCSTLNKTKPDNVQSGLASHSISESALHVLSSPSRNNNNINNKNSPHQTPVKNSDSKNSLKRKKMRKRKPSSSTKKSDSGSEGLQAYDLPKLTESLLNTEKISTEQMTIIKDLSAALSLIQLPKPIPINSKLNLQESQESDEDGQLLVPNFKIGPYTSAHMTNEAKLGSLAALANYNNEDGECNTGTDDHNSSFSEQAWDNYQEKYNSENYSEGFDSDAARRLLEFGDDYRAFLDSQSDCCSSLSAANNLDSLSPPRMDSLTNNQPTEIKLTQETITSSVVDHARRRRTLELEYERRRRTLEIKRKASQDNIFILNNNIPCSPTTNNGISNINAVTPKNSDSIIALNRTYPRSAAVEAASRRLDFETMTSTNVSVVPNQQSTPNGIYYKKTSESDTSLRRRKHSEDGIRRRSRNLEKSFKVPPYSNASSSSNSDSEDEKEVNNLIQQSRNSLENTEALKIRSHLLRPEDYTEIIATCRDNIHCLNTVLHGPPGTVLPVGQQNQIRELLSSWETFLAWSENAGAARKMQEEMFILKNMLNRLGCKQLTDLDSESSIQLSIEELKNEKSDLQAYRTNMLRLNASVHSWLTRQEMKVQKELKALKESNDLKLQQKQQKQEQQQQQHDNFISNKETKDLVEGEQQEQIECNIVVMNAENKSLDHIIQSENEFHKHLKDEVSEMYKAWDEADSRINSKLETLQGSLNAWVQLENGLSEFHQVLGKDRGTLEGLEGALENGRSNGDLAQNVKLVAKLLSERVDNAKQQIAQVAQEQQIDPHQLIHITRFAASNGSLSDSGISDGGTTSDGGLSERERRLGVLRRLAKQLESALAPGSEALKSISARMEAAEAELKKLQTTCREIIVRTAVQQQNKATATITTAQQEQQNVTPTKLVPKSSALGSSVEEISPSKSTKKRKARKSNKNGNGTTLADSDSANNDLSDDSKKSDRRNRNMSSRKLFTVANGGSGDPDDPKSNSWDPCNSSDDESENKRSWSWRVARVALPMQLALLTLFCAACLMQPHCCDSFNNFSMSFTPQLRYVRGPPPI